MKMTTNDEKRSNLMWTMSRMERLSLVKDLILMGDNHKWTRTTKTGTMFILTEGDSIYDDIAKWVWDRAGIV